MNISRRDLFHLAAISGLSLTSTDVFAKLNEVKPESFFEFKGVGNVTLLHICDLHAHLKPLYWREPSTLISAKELIGTPGFLCGKAFMQYYGIKPNTIRAYFDTYIGFEELAKKYGKMGGVAT